MSEKRKNKLTELIVEALGDVIDKTISEQGLDFLPKTQTFKTEEEAQAAYSKFIVDLYSERVNKLWKLSVENCVKESSNNIEDSNVVELYKEFGKFVKNNAEHKHLADFLQEVKDSDKLNQTSKQKEIDAFVDNEVLEDKPELAKQDINFLQVRLQTVRAGAALYNKYVCGISTQPELLTVVALTEVQAFFLLLTKFRECYDLTDKPITNKQILAVHSAVHKDLISLLLKQAGDLQKDLWFAPKQLLTILVENLAAKKCMDCFKVESNESDEDFVEGFAKFLDKLVNNDSETKSEIEKLMQAIKKAASDK